MEKLYYPTIERVLAANPKGRYWLFSGLSYYPRGGWRDFDGAFETAEAAQEYLLTLEAEIPDWYQILDTETMQLDYDGTVSTEYIENSDGKEKVVLK
jgi:hypothetical protein